MASLAPAPYPPCFFPSSLASPCLQAHGVLRAARLGWGMLRLLRVGQRANTRCHIGREAPWDKNQRGPVLYRSHLTSYQTVHAFAHCSSPSTPRLSASCFGGLLHLCHLTNFFNRKQCFAPQLALLLKNRRSRRRFPPIFIASPPRPTRPNLASFSSPTPTTNKITK